MKQPESILTRLTVSLGIVAAIGLMLLMIFIWIEYQISIFNFADIPNLRRSTYELAEHVLLPMLVLAVPMAMAGRWAIRRGMRPLTQAAEQIDSAKEQARGVRIDASTLPVEAKPFADAVNDLLDRVDNVAAMQEAFAADIAHELRTPLTLLSLQLEAMNDPAAAAMRTDVATMQRLLDQMMLMAQVQAAQVPATMVDLHEVAADVVAMIAPNALAHGKNIELIGDQHFCVSGRKEAIAAVLRNLVENALRVTPAGESVRVIADQPYRLVVQDGGQGLSQEKLQQMVLRLHRADHASHDGAGLGLSIVSRIMAAHQGELTTDPETCQLKMLFPSP